MNREELAESMARKAALLTDLHQRTDVNGHVVPIVRSEADERADTLRQAMHDAVDAHDPEGAAVFAEALAKMSAPAPAGSADQGPRGPITHPAGPLAERIAKAEAEGDWSTAQTLKSAWTAQIRRTLGAH